MKKRWTHIEVEFLRVNYSKIGPAQCADVLGRPIHSVKHKAVRSGFAKERRPFTDEELTYIKANYAHMGPTEIAEKLNVKCVSVVGVSQRNGLKMTPRARGKISTRTNTGRKMSEKTKAAIITANKKHYEPKRCSDCGAEILRRATRCRECAARERGGEGHNWYKGGVTPLYGIVSKKLYPVWKFPILARDDFECQECGDPEKLEVHHLRLFTEIRDKVMNANPHLSPVDDKFELAELIVKEHRLDDGITLCCSCHNKNHLVHGMNCLETPNASGEGNQQPSRSNVINIVNRKVQRITGEDSQPISPTRASRTFRKT